MKKILTSISLFAALSLSVSACSSSSTEYSETPVEDFGVSESAMEPVEPFAGQCPAIGSEIMSSTQALMITGTAYFSILEDKLLEQVWDAGYQNLNAWIEDVESVNGVLSVMDTTSLTADEQSQINYLTSATNRGVMFEALRLSDKNWFTETHGALISIGAACDGRW